MPNDRRIRENILVPTGKVAPEDIYIRSLDGDFESLNPEIGVGDLVLYDKRTGRTIKKGQTVRDVPKLSVAVAIDPQGIGYPTRLKHSFGGYLDGCAIDNVTTEPGSCGCNQVMDFYTACTFQGTSYSISIETRGDRELDTNLWNQWTRETFSVNLNNYSCDTCTNGIDCKAVMCALAAKINSHSIKRNTKRTGAFLKRALKQQVKNRRWAAYAIFENDCEYSITHHKTDCEDCVHMDGIGGIIIDGGEPILFKGATLSTDPTKSLKGKQNLIAARINKAFKQAKVEGSAVVKQQLYGTGAPCCDFKILVNSCVKFELIDGEGTPLVGVCSNPFEACKTDPYCIGCDDGTEWTPTCGIRVVALGHEITCNCNDPVDRTSWYHREVRIIVPTENNFSQYKIREIQKVSVPTNLGVQWTKRILDASNGGQGFAYDNWVMEKTGIYRTNRKGTALTDSIVGLACKDMVCSINIQHGLHYNEKSVNGSRNSARGRTIILLNNKLPDLYAEIKEYMDPWLASLNCGNFGPLQCTHDTDQIEATNYVDTAKGVADGSPNADNLLGGTADGVVATPVGTDDTTGDGVDDPQNNDLGN